MKNKKVILLALIFGIIAAMGMYWYIDYIEKKLDQTEYGQVIVPREEVPINTQVDRSMFKFVDLPVAYIHPNAITNPEEIDGAITKSMLMAEEQLLAGKLVQKEQYEDGLAYQIKSGYRAVTIPINLVSGLSGLVKPGDSVDIVVTVDAEKADGNSETVTTYVLQDILVLAVDNIIARNASESGSLDRNTITLEVSSSNAPQLVLASERGSLRLLLRSPVDGGKTNIPPANMRQFLN
ncbi:pilus assembly protein CpaB [Desulfitispora alkaliphila]|uniref:Flp pilus assembly protein CpaB n=1 Tax=Desulfitispora alkaliphila TaxID=622674 RepID=UPI003D1E1C04